ncbi:esterase/lipase family protein [Aquabacterium humicola]|uniref:esterase/lipase family protein n=1 Tax=Aquabacterium humicola TaxID=3237377 RepID=UPI002543D564|nr:alpha/beta fold hydrolase [Rubrivivax pictus]
MDQNQAAPTVAPPSIGLLGIEPLRALCEFVGSRFLNAQALPPGDGHPVVMFPGLASDRHALIPLRDCCESLGYVVYDWAQGFNTGPPPAYEPWLDGLAAHVGSIARRHGRRASVLGWSLGGIYAREVAKRVPQATRHVITLGSPFAGTGRENNVAWVYRLLAGEKPIVDEALAARLRSNPPVPTTSVYSRSDGVVAWQACLLDETEGEAENIEVDGSHIGLGWNAEVLRIVADRLSQPEGEWQRWGAEACDA